jgi:hypothetical protein
MEIVRGLDNNPDDGHGRHGGDDRPAIVKKSWRGVMDDEGNTMKVIDLKTRIARAEYDVDHDAVAEAFVRRMLAVHGAMRRADVRAMLGGAFDEIRVAG